VANDARTADTAAYTNESLHGTEDPALFKHPAAFSSCMDSGRRTPALTSQTTQNGELCVHTRDVCITEHSVLLPINDDTSGSAQQPARLTLADMHGLPQHARAACGRLQMIIMMPCCQQSTTAPRTAALMLSQPHFESFTAMPICFCCLQLHHSG
jgi:hypothetical protein